MSTYNLNIDTVNTSLDFYQAEKYIYGSSRLGMLKDSVNVLGSGYTNTDTSNFVHTLGNKRYELSNHLGNVLTVISDKPIPHNNGGTVDYWQADIKSAYDYSPFGVMLTGRTFEGRETVCHDSTVQATQNALEEGFGSWGSWTAMADGLVTYVADEMQVSNPSTSKKNIGASKTFTTGEGLHSVSFVVIGNMCSNIVIWPPSNTPIPIQVIVRDNANNIVASGNYTAAGSYNLSFTPASAGLTYRIEFYMANASAFCFFRVDDVLVSYEDESVVTVCKEVENGYRYGFNSMEKDDEVKGRGNSYDFGARMYDSRLGRWLTIDPLYRKYPAISSYSFSLNSPLLFKDPDGKDAIVTVQKDPNGGGKITISSTIYITGKAANAFNAAEYNKQAKKIYKSGNYTNDKGENFEISFDIKFEYLPVAPELQPGDNILVYDRLEIASQVLFQSSYKIDENGAIIGDVITTAGTVGKIGKSDAIGKTSIPTLHEVLHFLGLSDRYTESVNSEGERTTIPDIGFENDIMGSPGVSKDEKQINQVHYDNYGQEYSTKESGRYILQNKVDINPSDGSIKGGSSDGERPIKQ